MTKWSIHQHGSHDVGNLAAYFLQYSEVCHNTTSSPLAQKTPLPAHIGARVFAGYLPFMHEKGKEPVGVTGSSQWRDTWAGEGKCTKRESSG